MKPITECRACKSSELSEFLDLGEQYLSDFRDDDLKPPKYPLVAVYCHKCSLVQLKHTTPPQEMYHERYGFKSGISQTIREDLDDAVLHAFQYVNDPVNWLDIACNDGTLLSFVPENIYRVGVDPVTFLCVEAEAYADLIINDFFDATVGGEFDVITSVSCFYDMPDPSRFVLDVKNALAPGGIWLIQQNYLLTSMQLNGLDNFCHEHLEYYTLKSLENLLNRFDLEVVEVRLSTVNGGSIRTMVAHKDAYQVDESVAHQRKIEHLYGVDMLISYQMFAEDVVTELNKLRRLVTDLKDHGHSIAILAASTRGATLWQSAEFDSSLIDYAVERNPAKVGRMFSAIGVPIIGEEEARKRKFDYMIIGPWFFAPEIIDREQDYLKAGGHLIMPLPEVEIIDG